MRKKKLKFLGKEIILLDQRNAFDLIIDFNETRSKIRHFAVYLTIPGWLI